MGFLLTLLLALPFAQASENDFVVLSSGASPERIDLSIPTQAGCESTIATLLVGDGIDSIRQAQDMLDPQCEKEFAASSLSATLFPSGRKHSNSEYEQKRLLTFFLNHSLQNKSSRSFCKDYIDGLRELKAGRKLFGSVEPFSKAIQWEAARKYGLLEADLYALKIYTKEDFKLINPALRSGKELDPQYAWIKERVDRVLNALPSYSGEVRRNAYLDEDVGSLYKVGETVCDKAFTSTSLSTDWNWKPELIREDTRLYKFKMKVSKRGHQIKDFSHWPAENEVLMEAGTCFKVVARESTADAEEIEMTETDDSNLK